MKLLSIDIGIKNLAYCFFNIDDNNNYNIIDWNIINLINQSKQLCCAVINKKKCEPYICNKTAKYEKNNKFYCKTHAKSSGYFIPNDKISENKIKRMNLKSIYKILNDYSISHNKKVKKNELILLIKEFIKKNFLNYVTPLKKANDVNLITLGKNMRFALNKLIENQRPTHVIIENQISPIANRMKTIQGMITQYFIMKNIYNVEYISAINKLKPFLGNKKTNYVERKKKGIEITFQLIQYKNFKHKWINIFEESKKKDDLADSFLQGITYLFKNNKINIDISKINI